MWTFWQYPDRIKGIIQIQEQVKVAQFVRKFPAVYETRGSISCSQACATELHPEPTESTPTQFIKVSFNIIVSSTPKSLYGLCPSYVTIKILYALLASP